MGEVKRRRPWEEEKEESNISQTLVFQTLICIFIIGSIFFLSKTNTNTALLERINSEIKKQVSLEEIQTQTEEMKAVIMNYINGGNNVSN